MRNEWHWDVAFAAARKIVAVVPVTIEATLLGFVVAAALGLAWTIARRSRSALIRGVLHSTMELIRRTPLLVQLLFLYVAFPRLSVFAIGVVGLGVHYSTYLSEVYRAGIESVDRGQWEAARALNFSRQKTWTHIILPQAIRPIVPMMGNYLIVLFKETPLLFAINVMEMMAVAKQFGSETFRYLEAFTIVGVFFFLLSYPASLIVRWLETRFVRAS